MLVLPTQGLLVNMFNKNKTFFWFMLLGSACWLVILSFYIYEGLKTKNWLSTNGVIISASSLRIDHNKERYIIECKYKYEAEGNTLYGSNISGSNIMYTRSEINEELKKYAPDTNITIFYEPNNPQNAYLKTGVDNGLYILLVVGFGIFIFSFINIKKLNRLKET